MFFIARAEQMSWPPGSHGSTFGGNPVACAAACAVVATITDELLSAVVDKGQNLSTRLERLPSVVEVRGAGLLLGVEVDHVARDVIAHCLDRGVVVGSAGERVLRLTPSLTITDEELEHALAVLQEALE